MGNVETTTASTISPGTMATTVTRYNRGAVTTPLIMTGTQTKR